MTSVPIAAPRPTGPRPVAPHRRDDAGFGFAVCPPPCLRATWAAPDLAVITPDSALHQSYFPERTLAQWLHQRGYPSTVYAFPQTGVRPLRTAYQALIELHCIDAVVLVDGGTDILMRGDESGLGTPEENLTSVAALAALNTVKTRLVVSVGFGIDAYHGVNHVQVLENIAALERDGAYLGAFSIPRATREGALYLDAVTHAQHHTPEHPSIVNGSIAAAVRGSFGDVQFTDRTRGSELFVNPLRSLYFAFDLPGLAARCPYLDRLEDTHLMRQLHSRITEFRESTVTRPPRRFPH
ncbi:DUF1152 domain-containing protein [Streptomyces syringium]|uniref:DUF1152 domain-containing protein n=1 Tax=Streptomyces syringium TaxID=76729 RepID=UPI003650E546